MARIFFVLFLFLCCCKKKDAGSPVPEPVVTFAYTIDYDSVITVYNDGQYNFPFFVKVLAGNIDTNKLNFSITGLPQGITVDPQSQLVGHVLGGTFNFKASGAVPANYPIYMDITGKNVSEHRRLILKVKPAPDCAPWLVGDYSSCFDYCNPASVFNYTAHCSTVADTPYLLKITNLRAMGDTVVIRSFVSSAGITIPVQQVHGLVIWGKGTYGKDSRAGHTNDYVISIADTVVSGTDTSTCSVNIKK